MLETIANAGFFHKLVGMPVAYSDEVLPKLWNKYQLLFPEHEIFHQPHSVDFSHLLPFYIHGDGGRTFKKDSIMILSMFSAFGEGTRKKPVDLQPVPNSGQKRSLGASDAFEPGVNLKGNPFTNRYLFAAMKTELYKKKRKRFEKLLHHWGQYLADLFNQGFNFNGEVWKVAILGLTGDAPFLREAGNHIRSFSNVRKSASSRAILKGVCYLCEARRTHGPAFEDVRIISSEWVATTGHMNPLPWTQPSPLIQHLPIDDCNIAGFYKPDVFHIFHAGLGMDFAASACMYICKTVFKRSRLDLSLGDLKVEFKQFLQQTKEKVNFSILTMELLGYASSKSFPKGHWSKNMDTARVCKFVEHVASKYALSFADTCIPLLLDACGAIHQFMQIIFNASFFLTEMEGWQLISSGHAFLLDYVKLAREAFREGLCLFALKPVMHMFAHIVHTALEQFKTCPSGVINPAAEATFMSEDYIGKIARISRRVSPKKHGIKIMYRYMVAVEYFLRHPDGLEF